MAHRVESCGRFFLSVFLTWTKQIRRWHDECLRKLDLDEHPRIVTTSKRAFIILPATHHLECVTTRLDVLVKRWGTHFKHREL